MNIKDQIKTNEDNINELVDFLEEAEQYLYDWSCTYTGTYGYVDHSKWNTTCMVLFEKYKFDLEKIKEDIKSGTILIHRYRNDNPKLQKYEDQLYKAHKDAANAFEEKYFRIV